jgi:hypothetical protein
VTLPDDAARAETVAVFLAGNLARDEASDLLQGLAKPGAQKPAGSDAPATGKGTSAPASAVAENRRDADDLERMRGMLHDGADRGGRARVGGAIGRYVVSAALLVPGIVIYRNGGEDVALRREIGLGMIGGAAALSLVGTLELLSSSDEEAVYADFTTIEHDGQEPSAVVHRTERAWETRAESAKSRRQWGGYFDLGLSLFSLVLGSTYALPGSRYDPNLSVVFLAVGGVGALAGIYTLVSESSIERSYAAWQVLRRDRSATGAAGAVRPTLGFAPMPGGAYFSGGFAF